MRVRAAGVHIARVQPPVRQGLSLLYGSRACHNHVARTPTSPTPRGRVRRVRERRARCAARSARYASAPFKQGGSSLACSTRRRCRLRAPTTCKCVSTRAGCHARQVEAGGESYAEDSTSRPGSHTWCGRTVSGQLIAWGGHLTVEMQSPRVLDCRDARSEMRIVMRSPSPAWLG